MEREKITHMDDNGNLVDKEQATRLKIEGIDDDGIPYTINTTLICMDGKGNVVPRSEAVKGIARDEYDDGTVTETFLTFSKPATISSVLKPKN